MEPMTSQSGDPRSPMPIRPAAWISFCTIAIADIALVFLILLILQPYLYDLNALLGSVTGLLGNYMLLFVILAAIFIAWFIISIVRCKQGVSQNVPRFNPGRAEFAISISIIGIWNAFYAILGYAAGGEVFIILRYIEGIALYFYIALNAILVLFLLKAIPAILRFTRKCRMLPQKRRYGGLALVSAILMGYTVCFTLPFAAMPTTISNTPLPPKPLIIGHRGASHYAPENTIEAAQAALQFNAIGWEVDVQVSHDGVLFLLHDDDLRRTTDIETSYPGLASVLACDLNYSQIQALDAGSWFADDDPYGTIASGVVPRSQAESYRGVKIPTLEEAIDFSEMNGLILEVDFKSAPHGHPYHDTARGAMIAMLNASILGKNAWVYTSSVSAENLSRLCTRSCSVDLVIANGYDGVNLDLDVPNALLREYYARGIPTVVYTVDSVPIFSTLWALGVTYVKTGRPWLFTNLDQPIPYMDYVQYAALWLIFLATGCGSVIIVFFLRRKALMIST